MNRQWVRGLLLYSSKAYRLPEMIKQARDQRKRPQVSAATIFTIMLFGFLFRIQSMEALDWEIRNGRLRKLVGPGRRQPSHDTIRRALCQWDLESLRACHDKFVAKFKQLKGPWKGAVDGWRVAAIDGVELFSSTSRCCSECLTRHRQESGNTEYFHRAVFMQKVGGDPRVIYGFELLGKRDGSDKLEGEVSAAKRLIRQVHRRIGRVADILTLDALYAQAPLIHEALDAGMDVVIRMKEDRRSIVKDAMGLFRGRPADVTWEEWDSKGNHVYVQAWDESDLTSWSQVRVPLRMVRVIRKTERRIVTTCHKDAVPTRTVDRIADVRWDIENNGFHDLKTYWHMDHAFVHHPTGLRAWLGILVLAVNLMYTYVYGHLHHFRRWGVSLQAVVDKMREEIRWCRGSVARFLWDGG
ncbi:MAG: transposase [Alicyclobacillus sp.]|nr:transposase [Alicyclobacillus sp.]